MAVFHPELERKYCHTQYPYYPLEQMVDKFFFSQEDADGIKKVLAQITGGCEQCHQTQATTGYFPKGILTWDGAGPVLSKVIAAPKKLCTDCCLRKISQDLTNNKESYVEIGLATPWSGDGVYISTTI